MVRRLVDRAACGHLNNVTDSGEWQSSVSGESSSFFFFFFAMTTQTFFFFFFIFFGKKGGRTAGYRCGLTIINDRR